MTPIGFADQKCNIGNAGATPFSYVINCSINGIPWAVAYHVIAVFNN